MFIRFVRGEIHKDSLVSAGLFIAAFDLLYDPLLSEYESFSLRKLMDWFDEHLEDRSRLKESDAFFMKTKHRFWQNRP